MKIPNKVWIKNEVYEVVYQKIIDDPEDIGYCDDEKKILYIKLGLNKTDTFDVLLHECLHAISLHYKIKLSHKTLDRLATALVDIAKLNGLIK